VKIIVIGLGNFGASLAESLMDKGAEVIGVDVKMNKVEALKDKLTYTICLDTSDEVAIQALPLKETDLVVISIGEDIGASLTTTAILKKLTTAKIIGRAINSTHETILNAMGIEKIIHPEASCARELANTICLKGAVKTMLLDKQFEILEIVLPAKFVGKTILDSNLRKDYNINVVTILREPDNIADSQNKSGDKIVLGVITAETILKNNDLLVIFGKNRDIEDFINKYSK